MSGSPKYSFAKFGRQVNEQLLRDQRARRERRERAAVQERDSALRDERRAATERQRRLAAEVSDTGLRQKLAEAQSRLDRVTTESELAAATGLLDQVERRNAGPRASFDLVAAQRAERERQRRAGDTRIRELTARLRALEQDARAAGVPLRDGARAAEALELLSAQVVHGDIADVLRLCSGLEKRLDASEEALDAAIDQLSRRRAILGSLIKALPEVGFAVDRGSLSESADGAIGLRAVRAGGETMAVVVEPADEGGHRVLYTSDRLQQEQRQGRGEAACAKLVEVIDTVQASAGHDGIELSAVGWDGPDRPPPPPHNATRRPHAEEAAARRPHAEEVKQQKGRPPWAH
ncbi:hypothetical protein JIG36_36080 [Actinoplanes sp. LDG1-06]|uniref:Uncharacterized protein n=1 Tax=Paractinoplanes ovalisporus TaxID=2810368 RepID=A0ABS2ANH0_9ACTN|nr:hypothetical protein [Actinoplanes ovalisporus]MBM2620933.1 hypothetical protein [Actinoplanes ovalisporus]